MMRVQFRLLACVVSCFFAFSSAFAEGVTYFGGPVISNADVALVHWSSDTSGGQSTMATFYADIVTSDYWSIFEQYSTPTSPSQKIGYGSFRGTYTLPLGPCNGNCVYSDTAVVNYIGGLINSNSPALPAITTDTGGRINTVLMLHFAKNVQILIANIYLSCRDFGATYEDFQTDAAHGGRVIAIGLIPDCGIPESLTASGALAEIVTDPNYADAPAWTNDQGLDIFLICDEQTAQITANGNSYEVYPLWANSSNKCISGERISRDGFEISTM